MFQGFKNWFSNSGTLMLAATGMFGGAIAAGASQVDFSSLVDTAFSSGFNWKVVAAAGITAFVQGALTYVTRMRGTAIVEIAGKPVLAPVVPAAAKPVATGTDKTVVVKK